MWNLEFVTQLPGSRNDPMRVEKLDAAFFTSPTYQMVQSSTGSIAVCVKSSQRAKGWPLALRDESLDERLHEVKSFTGLSSVFLDPVQLHLKLCRALQLNVQLLAKLVELVIDDREHFAGAHFGSSWTDRSLSARFAFGAAAALSALSPCLAL
jgi:hypothetical protein